MRWRKHVAGLAGLISLATAFSLGGCRSAAPAGSAKPIPDEPKEAAVAEVRRLDPPEAAVLVQAGEVVVLDVRTPEEFAAGHLAGAINVDFKRDDFASRLSELDRGRTYLVYCRSGNRSTRALPILDELGFGRVVNLDGGVLAWEKAGCSLEK